MAAIVKENNIGKFVVIPEAHKAGTFGPLIDIGVGVSPFDPVVGVIVGQKNEWSNSRQDRYTEYTILPMGHNRTVNLLHFVCDVFETESEVNNFIEERFPRRKKHA